MIREGQASRLRPTTTTRKFSTPNRLPDTQRSEPRPWSSRGGCTGWGEGKIGTMPPANRPPRNSTASIQRKGLSEKCPLPTQRGHVGPTGNQAGRTKGESRMTGNHQNERRMEATGKRRGRGEPARRGRDTRKCGALTLLCFLIT